MGASIFCWLNVTSQGEVITFSVLFGSFSGTIICLFPATIALTATKPNEIGSLVYGNGIGGFEYFYSYWNADLWGYDQ